MQEAIYYTARVGLVAAWLGVAVLLHRRRSEGGGAWSWPAIVAVVIASMRAWPWNYELLRGARVLLHRFGLYEHRLWIKFALATALLIGVCLLVGRLLRSARATENALCKLAMGMQSTLLAVETASLDELLPAFLFQQPWRYMFEGGCVAIAILGLVRAKRGMSGRRP